MPRKQNKKRAVSKTKNKILKILPSAKKDIYDKIIKANEESLLTLSACYAVGLVDVEALELILEKSENFLKKIATLLTSSSNFNYFDKACKSNNGNELIKLLFKKSILFIPGQEFSQISTTSTSSTDLGEYCSAEKMNECLYSIMYNAILNKNENIIKYLVNRGYDINNPDNEVPLLILAAYKLEYKHLNILKILLKNADQKHIDSKFQNLNFLNFLKGSALNVKDGKKIEKEIFKFAGKKIKLPLDKNSYNDFKYRVNIDFKTPLDEKLILCTLPNIVKFLLSKGSKGYDLISFNNELINKIQSNAAIKISGITESNLVKQELMIYRSFILGATSKTSDIRGTEIVLVKAEQFVKEMYEKHNELLPFLITFYNCIYYNLNLNESQKANIKSKEFYEYVESKINFIETNSEIKTQFDILKNNYAVSMQIESPQESNDIFEECNTNKHTLLNMLVNNMLQYTESNDNKHIDSAEEIIGKVELIPDSSNLTQLLKMYINLHVKNNKEEFYCSFGVGKVEDFDYNIKHKGHVEDELFQLVKIMYTQKYGSTINYLIERLEKSDDVIDDMYNLVQLMLSAKNNDYNEKIQDILEKYDNKYKDNKQYNDDIVLKLLKLDFYSVFNNFREVNKIIKNSKLVAEKADLVIEITVPRILTHILNNHLDYNIANELLSTLEKQCENNNFIQKKIDSCRLILEACSKLGKQEELEEKKDDAEKILDIEKVEQDEKAKVVELEVEIEPVFERRVAEDNIDKDSIYKLAELRDITLVDFKSFSKEEMKLFFSYYNDLLKNQPTDSLQARVSKDINWSLDSDVSYSKNDVIEVADGVFAVINKNLFESLDNSTQKKFENALNKGFVVRSEGQNGIKVIQNKLYELKINADKRLYTNKIYQNRDRKKLIIFDKQASHQEISKLAQSIKSIDCIDVSSENGQILCEESTMELNLNEFNGLDDSSDIAYQEGDNNTIEIVGNNMLEF